MPDQSEETFVVDASVVVDLFSGLELAHAARDALYGRQLIAPAHLDAEVLSAFGRLQRAEVMSVDRVTSRLAEFAAAPIERQPIAGLLAGAWQRRHAYSLSDALYVELAEQSGARLLTTDRRLARRYAGAEAVRTG